MSATDDTPLQPLLDDALIVLRAPTQVWSGRDGELGAQPIDGVYHGDVRHVRSLRLSCRDSEVEWISTAAHGPSRAVFGGLLRGLDDATPDPKVRLLRERAVMDGAVTETWTVLSRLTEPLDTVLTLTLEPDFGSLHDVKAGTAASQPAEMTTTDAATSGSATMRRVASMPSMSGICTSMHTTSGVSADAAATASAPVAASPTTVISPVDSRIMRNPARMTA